MIRFSPRTLPLFLLLAGCAAPLAAQPAWQPLTPTADAQPRSENAFVQAGDRYYLIGGRGMKTIDIYDPAANTWTQGAMPPIEMHHFQAVEHDGLIYVLGALSGPYPYEIPLAYIYIYDPVQDTWMVGPPVPPERRRGAAGAVVYQDRIYVVGGIVNGHSSHWVPWLDEYDPATNTWTALPDAPRPRDHFMAAVIDGKLYAAGGRNSGSAETPFAGTIAEVDVYDFEAQSWTTLPSPAGDIPTQRAGTAATVLDGELVVIGGESAAQEAAHEEVEALDPATGTWRALAPLAQGRHGMQAVHSPQGLYVVAGCAQRGGNPEITQLERYGPGTPGAPVGDALVAGTLTLADTEHLSADAARVTLTNTGGNQAVLVTYAMVYGTPGSVQSPVAFPYLLGPDEELVLSVTFEPAGDAVLAVKTMQPGPPLDVPLAMDDAR